MRAPVRSVYHATAYRLPDLMLLLTRMTASCVDEQTRTMTTS
jgi:hypothetical protein